MTWVRLIGCSLVFIFRCGLWFLMRQGKHLGILSSIFCQSILEACISQALRGIHGKTPYPLLVQRHRHFRASPQIHLLGIYMFSFSVWFVVWLVSSAHGSQPMRTPRGVSTLFDFRKRFYGIGYILILCSLTLEA